MDISEKLVQRCRALKAKGYCLALDDVVRLRESYNPLVEVVDIVKVDVLGLDLASLPKLVQRLKLWSVKLLAEKVDTAARARQCLAMGFDLFRGFFYGRPVVVGAW